MDRQTEIDQIQTSTVRACSIEYMKKNFGKNTLIVLLCEFQIYHSDPSGKDSRAFCFPLT